MFLPSDIYVNPVLTFFFAPLMIAALVTSILLFVKRQSLRKKVVIYMAFLGVLESLLFSRFWGEGMFIGFITLTCVGVMAVLNYSAASRYRILVGALFVILGGLELLLLIELASKAEVNPLIYLRGFTWLVLPLSLVLASLISGITILITAVKKHSQAQ